jgi:type II secretory pathway pseudopilin PulG
VRRAAATCLALALACSGGACDKKAAKPAAATPAAAGAPDSDAPIELPPYVPADAVAVIGFDGSSDWFTKYAAMSGMPAADATSMFGDVVAYLEKSTGLSLAKVHRGTVVVTGDSAALVVRDVGGEWKASPLPDDVALVRDGDYLVAGPRATVEKLVAVKKGTVPALAKDAPLAQLFARGSAGAGIAFAADLQLLDVPELKAKLGAVGATHALVSMGPHHARLLAFGDGKKMAAFVTMLESMLASQVKAMSEQRQRILAEASTTKGPSAEEFGVVFGSHSLAYIASVFHPKVEGNELRFELSYESSNIMPVVTVVGILSAVAVPAFMKYMRKAKTTEATQGIKRIYDGARAYYLEHHKMPRSVPLTPGEAECCKSGAGECPAGSVDWKAWKDLGFSVDGPTHYAYALDADATGFTARAIGDLDCDGIYSTFEIAGAAMPDGTLKGSQGIYKNQELE